LFFEVVFVNINCGRRYVEVIGYRFRTLTKAQKIENTRTISVVIKRGVEVLALTVEGRSFD